MHSRHMNTTTKTTPKITQAVWRMKLALQPDPANVGQWLPAIAMLPAGFRVTSMQITKDIKPGCPAIEVYTLINPHADVEPHTFKVARTGEELPNAGHATFLITAALPGIPAFHLFELL